MDESIAERFIRLKRGALEKLERTRVSESPDVQVLVDEAAKATAEKAHSLLEQYLSEIASVAKGSVTRPRSSDGASVVQLLIKRSWGPGWRYVFPIDDEPRPGSIGVRGLSGEPFSSVSALVDYLDNVFLPKVAGQLADDEFAATFGKRDDEKRKSARFAKQVSHIKGSAARPKFLDPPFEPCKRCGGKGIVGAFHCPSCRGSGKSTRPD